MQKDRLLKIVYELSQCHILITRHLLFLLFSLSNFFFFLIAPLRKNILINTMSINKQYIYPSNIEEMGLEYRNQEENEQTLRNVHIKIVTPIS